MDRLHSLISPGVCPERAPRSLGLGFALLLTVGCDDEKAAGGSVSAGSPPARFEAVTKASGVSEKDLDGFEKMLSESADLKRLVESPVFSSDEQFNAISAIVKKAGLSVLTGNFLKVVARNRRLFAVPAMIRSFREIAAMSGVSERTA